MFLKKTSKLSEDFEDCTRMAKAPSASFASQELITGRMGNPGTADNVAFRSDIWRESRPEAKMEYRKRELNKPKPPNDNAAAAAEMPGKAKPPNLVLPNGYICPASQN